MKKSIFRRFLLLFATFALGLGFATSVKGQKEILKTSATPVSEVTELYFKANTDWVKFDAVLTVWIHGHGEFVELEKLPNLDRIYKFQIPQIPGGWEGGLNFVRFESGNPSWENHPRNQTEDVLYDETGDLFVQDDPGWDSTEGYWIVFNAEEHEIPKTFNNGEVIYFAATEDWHTDRENKIAAFFFNKLIEPEASKFVKMNNVRNNIYEAEVPGNNYNYILFALLKDVSQEWAEGNKVDQTGDLAHVEGEYLFLHDAYKWIEFDGNFVDFEPVISGINKNHVRIWLNRNGHHEGEVYTLLIDGKHHLPSGYTLSVILEYNEDKSVKDSRHFAYFDVPLLLVEGKEIDVAIVNSLNTEVITTFSAGEYEETDNSKLWTVDWDDGIESFTLTKKALELVDDQKVVNEFLGKMLEGYLTCLRDINNGYLAFDLINTNFLPGGKANMLPGGDSVIHGDLGEVIITDYEYTPGYDYDVDVRAADMTDAYSKYIMMELMFINNPPAQGNPQDVISTNTTNATFAIVFISVLIAFGYIYFILPRKKRA